jgi:hypothetical protein
VDALAAARWTVLLGGLLCGVLCGCQTAAPLHVWSTPKLEATGGRQVLVAEIAGPRPLAQRLRRSLWEAAPRDPALRTALLTRRDIPDASFVRLASASDAAPSDMEVVHAARAAGVDFVLFGEILAQHAQSSAPIAVSWRLFDVAENRILGGQPVRLTQAPDQDRPPTDPTASPPELSEQQLSEVARRSWELLAPYVSQTQAELAEPWLLGGSAQVRKANRLAASGGWPAAEKRWREVAERYPGNHAALHNLALAAVAREDFAAARRLAREALAMHRSKLYEATFVRIEQHQLAYHQSFNLPPPEGGWFFVRDASAEGEDD